MAEAKVWRVTLHRGGNINRRASRVLCQGEERSATIEYRSALPPGAGQAVAMWQPDGALHAYLKARASDRSRARTELGRMIDAQTVAATG